MATKAKRGRPEKNRVRNSGFEEKLAGWSAEGAAAISAENGQLVHSGVGAAMLAGVNAFLSQTVNAGRGARLVFIAHLRGTARQANGPVVIRLRWVDSTGAFIATALEIFIPQNQLAADAWTMLYEYTNLAPAGTAGLNIRIDAPLSEGEAAVVIDDLVVC